MGNDVPLAGNGNRHFNIGSLPKQEVRLSNAVHKMLRCAILQLNHPKQLVPLKCRKGKIAIQVGYILSVRVSSSDGCAE
jgi:hypothetical protein